MSGELRVGLCFGTFPPDRNGGSDFAARFAAELGMRDCHVHVITSRSLADGEPARANVTVHRVVDDWRLAAGRRSLRAVNEIIGREHVDVLHVLFPDSVVQADYQLPAALGLGRVPLVTTFWNLALGRLSPVRLRTVSLALLARSRVLTSHDPQYLRVLRRIGRLRDTAWLPVGNNIGSAPRRAGAPGPFRLAYFGQLDATRGVEELFEAVRRISARRDIRLTMIGSAGRPERYPPGELDRYRRLAVELGIGELLEWTGYLTDGEAAQALADADVCVLPYRRNSLGRSALAAALENGVPVVLGGTPDGVAPLRDAEHVALVPPGDADALTARLGELVEEPAKLRALAAGAASGARFFSWDEIAERALRIYSTARLGRRRLRVRFSPTSRSRISRS